MRVEGENVVLEEQNFVEFHRSFWFYDFGGSLRGMRMDWRSGRFRLSYSEGRGFVGKFWIQWRI